MLSQMKLSLQVISFKSILLEVPGKLIRGAKDGMPWGATDGIFP